MPLLRPGDTQGFRAIMLIGSGLLAHAFTPAFSQREDVCIYAAGVSNSGCTNPHEFAREQKRLVEAVSKEMNSL